MELNADEAGTVFPVKWTNVEKNSPTLRIGTVITGLNTEQYSGVGSALKFIPLPVHIETMYTHIRKISLDANSAIALFLF